MTLDKFKKHSGTIFFALGDEELYFLRLGKTVFRYFVKPKKQFTIDGRIFSQHNFFVLLNLILEGGGSVIKQKNEAGRTATK